MKKIAIIATLIIATTVAIVSCDSKREPGKTYMPDMAYSRAYETYAARDSNLFTTNSTRPDDKIFYNNIPPSGTIKRGELYPYTLPNDSIGYKMSASTPNPLKDISKAQLAEAGRLFDINCAICHGANGTASGPLSSKIGAIANLTTPQYIAMTDGTMFHSITYGKNNMGSYAAQITKQQRWMIIDYIRTLQPKATGTTKVDSTVVAKAGK